MEASPLVLVEDTGPCITADMADIAGTDELAEPMPIEVLVAERRQDEEGREFVVVALGKSASNARVYSLELPVAHDLSRRLRAALEPGPLRAA